MKGKILNLLENNGSLKAPELASMLGLEEAAVAVAIRELEADGILRGYSAIIDWEKFGQESVIAYIEVRVTPQRGQGFDRVAERIYQYPQVQACNQIGRASCRARV